MNLKEVGLLDDKKRKQTVQKGYDQIKIFLEKLPDSENFWLK